MTTTTIELPNEEFTNNFVQMVDIEIANRTKERLEAVRIKTDQEKIRDNSNLAISQQESVIAEKDMYIAGLTALKEQAQ